jgi:outer membrane protein TolC
MSNKALIEVKSVPEQPINFILADRFDKVFTNVCLLSDYCNQFSGTMVYFIRFYKSTLAPAMALLLLYAGSAWAALDHQALQRSDSLTFQQVFDSALDNAPEALSTASRQEQLRQYDQLSRRLFPGQPVLEANFIDDGPLDAVGLRELEAGLRLNLWRPGERQQSENLASNLSDLYQAWQTNLTLEVAGRVRAALWALQQADEVLQLELEALAETEQFASLAAAQLAAGSVPESDLLRARSLVMAQQQAVYEAEAELVDAEREYTVLTGLAVRPTVLFQEQQSSASEISISHPLLQFLQANVELARSKVQQTRLQAGESPSLSFGVRRERGSSQVDYIDSLGIGLSFPLGRSPAAARQVSDARRDQADMQVVLQRGKILLEQQLHEAEHQLYTARLNLELVGQQAELSEQQWEMASLAYELGETDALAVSLALQDLLAARKNHQAVQLRLNRLISDYNQSLGLLP